MSNLDPKLMSMHELMGKPPHQRVQPAPTAPENKSGDLPEHSDKIYDILNHQPKGILRHGTSIMMLIVVSLITFSAFVSYPETADGVLKLTYENIPKTVSPKTNSRIIKLFVKHKQPVKADMVLAILESNANAEEVLALSEAVDSLHEQAKNNVLKNVAILKKRQFSNLGELQKSYQAFDEVSSTLITLFDDGYYQQKNQLIDREVRNLVSINERLWNQKQSLENDYELALKEYEANKRLASRGIISSVELQRAESRLYSKKMPIEQIESSILSNNSQINLKRGDVIEFDKNIEEIRNQYKLSLQALRADIVAWKSQFLLVSPEDGIVIFPFMWQENQNVQANSEVFIISNSEGPVMGLLSLPQRNIGKVKTGQKVLVTFQGYPSEEYGVIRGAVKDISEITDKENNILITVTLGNELKTTKGKTIAAKTGLVAKAEIITEDMSLLSRFTYQIQKLFKK